MHSQSIREHSSVGLEHLPYKQRVRGSTPFAPTTKTTYRDVSRLFLCCFVWVFARSVGLAPRALAVAVCSDASIAQPSPSPAAFGCHSSPWQSHPLVFAKRCRTWIWGCGDRLILLLGLKPCAQRYPRQLRFDSLCSHYQDDLQRCESSFFVLFCEAFLRGVWGLCPVRWLWRSVCGLQTKKPINVMLIGFLCRGTGIRTRDFQLPKLAR